MRTLQQIQRQEQCDYQAARVIQKMEALSDSSPATGSVSAITAKRVKNLEKFMEAVAREVNCLPDYFDSLPDCGNSHIIRAIQKLKQNVLA